MVSPQAEMFVRLQYPYCLLRVIRSEFYKDIPRHVAVRMRIVSVS
jgi:hypothetical protein